MITPNVSQTVMAPLTRGRCDEVDGVPGALSVTYYTQRASAGLLISEGTLISKQAHGWSGAPGIYTPAQIAGWKQTTDSVHAQGGLIFCQV